MMEGLKIVEAALWTSVFAYLVVDTRRKGIPIYPTRDFFRFWFRR